MAFQQKVDYNQCMILAQALGLLFFLINPHSSFSAVPGTAGILIGVTSHHGRPLVESTRGPNGDQLTGGLIKKLGEALAKELQVKAEFLLVPKTRMVDSVVSGRVDFMCHLNPIWQPGFVEKFKDQVEWTTEEIYSSRNVIAYLQGAAVNSIEDLKGKRVASIYNFIYQKYDDLFQKKELIREDGPSTESNIQKLLKDRVPFVILSNLELDFYRKKYSDLRSFDPGWDQVDTQCVVSKKSKITAKQIDQALKALRKRQFFAAEFFENL